MNLKTFTAPSMIACLAQVKGEMGPHAVILHTRTYFKREWLGLKKREFVEITAGKGMNVPGRNRNNGGGGGGNAGTFAPRAAQPTPQMAAYLTGAHVTATTHVQQMSLVPAADRVVDVVQTQAISRMPHNAPPGRDLLATPAADRILGTQVARDVEELKKLVGSLVDTIHKKDAPNVPEELFDHYLALIQAQVAEELAGEIVQSIKKHVRPEHLSNNAFVKDKIAEHIERLVPTTGPILRTKLVGPHVVALIGPTGVGKTTTIAKLAANLKLREKKKVGLITLDTYRIAAIDQLKKYADILGSNLRVVGSGEELREALRAMSDCEYILIDTAGRSPRDTMKINELKTFLDAAQPDEIHLVLSTTASQECVEFAMERFGEVKFDKVIFTKLDEAAHVGTVLNVVRKLNTSLSYVTTGQDVPDDIEVGHGKRLAHWIMNGDM